LKNEVNAPISEAMESKIGYHPYFSGKTCEKHTGHLKNGVGFQEGDFTTRCCTPRIKWL